MPAPAMSTAGSSVVGRGRGAPPHVPGLPPPIPIQGPEGPALVEFPTQSQWPSLDVGSPSGSAVGSTIGDPDGRYEVYIHAGSLMPSNNVSSTITTIMRENMEVGACTFAMISPERLLNYWEKFQTKCRWDPALTDKVYQLWHQRSGVQYENMLSSWKKNLEEEETTPCCDSAVWQALVAYWNKQDVSEQCKQNRLSEPANPRTGITRHRGGSRGAVEVAPKIEIETGLVAAQEWEVVQNYHVCPNGTYKKMEDVKTDVQETGNQPVEGSSGSEPTVEMPSSPSYSGTHKSRVFTKEEVDCLLAQVHAHYAKVLKELDIMQRNMLDEWQDKLRKELYADMQSQMQEHFSRWLASQGRGSGLP